MPTKTTTETNQDEEIFVAWTGFTCAAGDVSCGMELRGSDPRVLAVPANFVPRGTPRSEWPSPFDHSFALMKERGEQAEAERKANFASAARANRVKLSVANTVTARRDFITEFDGRPATIEKGSEVPSTSPLAREHPDEFVE
jgi:hypothetical protein